MRDIYVITHTESEHHVQQRVGGWYDTPLTPRGHADAVATARRVHALVGARPAEIYSSDLLRAHQTAEALAILLKEPIVALRDLRERSVGSAGGMPEAWLQERVVNLPRGAPRLDHREGLPDAETKREFLTRIYRAVETILASPAELQIVVTHGFALTFVIAAWIGMPLDSAGYVNFRARPGGITHLHEDDLYFNRGVRYIDDRQHLDGG